MNTYQIRTSTNPDVFAPIDFSDIQYEDHIKTTDDKGRVSSEAWYIKSIVVKPDVPVVITDIADVLTVNEDFTEMVVTENTPFIITASVILNAESEQTFFMPMVRQDTGRTIYVAAVVSTGNVMTAVITLPTSGKWMCRNAELNSAIADQPFKFSFAGIQAVAIQ